MIDLYGVVLPDHSPVVEFFVNFVFPHCMLDVAFFNLVFPVVLEVMDLAGDFSAIFEVETLVDFRIATFA